MTKPNNPVYRSHPLIWFMTSTDGDNGSGACKVFSYKFSTPAANLRVTICLNA